MKGHVIQKNIPVSDTKLTLGLLVGFISSHLTADKLIPVNPRVITGQPKKSLMLEVKGTPALIIKLRLFLIAHEDDFGWYITSNQRNRCSCKTSTALSADKMACRADFELHRKLYSIELVVSGKLSNEHTSLDQPMP